MSKCETYSNSVIYMEWSPKRRGGRENGAKEYLKRYD